MQMRSCWAHCLATTVEQYVREANGACRQCETLTRAPMPARVVDKGIPTADLLAHIIVTMFANHLQLYRQEKILGRVGLAIACSTWRSGPGKPACGISRC